MIHLTKLTGLCVALGLVAGLPSSAQAQKDAPCPSGSGPEAETLVQADASYNGSTFTAPTAIMRDYPVECVESFVAELTSAGGNFDTALVYYGDSPSVHFDFNTANYYMDDTLGWPTTLVLGDPLSSGESAIQVYHNGIPRYDSPRAVSDDTLVTLGDGWAINLVGDTRDAAN